MSNKFKRVLSDSELLDVYRNLDNPKHDRDSVIEAMGAAVDAAMSKLAEQEPVMYARTYYGEIDWDEACVTEKNDGALIHATDMREEDFIRHGYAIIPLYTHPFATPMNSKTFCVSENEKCDTQTGGQVKNEKHKGN